MERVAKANIVRRKDGAIAEAADLLAVEEPLEIRIGYGAPGDRMQKSIAVTMRTPGHDFELAVGFLFTEGIISGYDQVLSIKYCEDTGKQQQNNVLRVELDPNLAIDYKKIERHFYTSSSCGVCSKSSIEAVQVNCKPIISSTRFSEQVIHQSPDLLRKAQQVFEYTGGLHAAGLFDKHGHLILMREDVGRHNALDKLIGAAHAKQWIPLSKYFVLLSGRASFELVQKSAMAGVPVLAAVGAPSSLAVQLAQDLGMTLLGFVRNEGFNIYCGKGILL